MIKTTQFIKEIIDIYKNYFTNPLDFKIEHVKSKKILFEVKKGKPYISIPKAFDNTLILKDDLQKIRVLFLLGKVLAHSLAYAVEKTKLPSYNAENYDCWSDNYGAIISMIIFMSKEFNSYLHKDYGYNMEEDIALIHQVLEVLYDKDFLNDAKHAEPYKRLMSTYGGLSGYIVRYYELKKEIKLSVEQRNKLLENVLAPHFNPNSNLFTSMTKYSKNLPLKLSEFYNHINTVILANNIKNILIPEPFVSLIIGDNHSVEIVDCIKKEKEKIYMQAGDILLVQGRGALSKFLAKTQKVLYWRTQSSHVLIAVSDGIFVDAVSGKGVSFKFLNKELLSTRENWRMIRLRAITKEQVEELQKAVIYYHGQDYNMAYMFKNKDKSFCSELAAKIYKKAGISIFNNRAPQYIKPSDFDKEADKQIKWMDITKEAWNDVLLIHKELKLYYIAFVNFSLIVEHSKKAKHTINNVMKIGYENGLFTEELFQYYMKFEKNFDENKHIQLWDDKFKR